MSRLCLCRRGAVCAVLVAVGWSGSLRAETLFDNINEARTPAIPFGWMPDVITDGWLSGYQSNEGRLYKLQSLAQDIVLNQSFDITGISLKLFVDPSGSARLYKVDVQNDTMTDTGLAYSAAAGKLVPSSGSSVNLGYGRYSLVLSNTFDARLNPDRTQNAQYPVPGPGLVFAVPTFGGSNFNSNKTISTGSVYYAGGGRPAEGWHGSLLRYNETDPVFTSVYPDSTNQTDRDNFNKYIQPFRYADGTAVTGPIDPAKPLSYSSSQAGGPVPGDYLGKNFTSIAMKIEGTPSSAPTPISIPAGHVIDDATGDTFTNASQRYQTAPYQQRTSSFVATESQTRIRIVFRTDRQSYMLSNVSVTSAADPSTNLIANGNFDAPGPVNLNVVPKRYTYSYFDPATRKLTTGSGTTPVYPEQNPTGWDVTTPENPLYTVDDLVNDRGLFLASSDLGRLLAISNGEFLTQQGVTLPANASVGQLKRPAGSTNASDDIAVVKGVVSGGVNPGTNAFHAVSLGGWTELSQVIDTVPGQTYDLSYFYRGTALLSSLSGGITNGATNNLVSYDDSGRQPYIQGAGVLNFSDVYTPGQSNTIPAVSNIVVYADGIAAVPEPGSAGLLALGVPVALARRRRR